MNKILSAWMVALVACSSTDSSSELRCEKVQDEWTRRAEQAVSDLTQCSTDNDCSRFFIPYFQCNGLEVSTCPIAVRADADYVFALQPRTSPVAADLCDRVEPGCTVKAPLCGAAEARCEQGHCTLVRQPLDEETLACGRPLASPSAVKAATRAPDGKGFCCAATGPTCGCASLGGFVADRCDCPNNGICDLAPPDWISETDEHGCNVYKARSPTTACCGCPDAGR